MALLHYQSDVKLTKHPYLIHDDICMGIRKGFTVSQQHVMELQCVRGLML